jgi:uncharacterized protein (TIGR03437 family)
MSRRLLGLAGIAVLRLAAQTSVVTGHNDNGRTGRYQSETLLSPAALKSGIFAKRRVLAVDGLIYGQPLYLSRVSVPGQGLRNVVFAATSHDSLYAFDADDESATGKPLWKVSFLDPAAAATPVSQDDVGCSVMPELGIGATPVLDPASGTIYVIAFTKEQGSRYVYRLHALDVATGAERAGSPVQIEPPGFLPVRHKQRTALLLANGNVYSSWSGHCDVGAYHGWVMAHDATSLKLNGFFNATPDDSGASFWNGGAGPASDADGNIFVVSANADMDGNHFAARYDESVLKLGPVNLALGDQFTPFNKLTLDQLDLDLGSSGALLLPDEAGSSAHPHLLYTSGKEGRMHLLDRDALGGTQNGSDAGALTSLTALNFHETFGVAAYFNNALYIGPQKAPLYKFPLAGAVLGFAPTAQTLDSNGIWGATPSISADGANNGIVWVITGNVGGTLAAYDASDLSLLYSSSALTADALGGYAEFSVPTIADGKVFAAAGADLAIFGEQTSTVPVVSAVRNAASYSTDAISPGSLIALFGSGLAGITASAPALPLPISMADTSVTINGFVAPLLYEASGQINAQVPWEVLPGPATVVVRTRGAVSAAAQISVQAAAPGIFTDASGRAAVINADGSVNSDSHPAVAGTIVSVWFTGQGPIAANLVDGGIPPSGQLVLATSPVSATIGDLADDFKGAAMSPQFAGVAQVNVKVPALTTGSYTLAITIAGKTSNSAKISVVAP